MAEGGVEDEIAADDGGDDSAGVDEEMGGSEEGVAADGAVPGDVPGAAER